MTQPDSNSLNEQESSATSSTAVYKAIIAIGVMGDQEQVERFTALWIADSEMRAHRIVEKLKIPVQLLALPEETE